MNKNSLIKKVEEAVANLSKEDLAKVRTYAEELLNVDHETLNMKEAQAIEICGFNPPKELPDDEWEAMLRRNEMSLLNEERRK